MSIVWHSPTVYTNAAILEVYDSSVTLKTGKNGLGWVKIHLLGFIGEVDQTVRDQWTVDALLLMSYSFKPTTEDAQSTTKKTPSPMNQQYGMIAPPRRGDKAVVIHGPDEYFVLGIYPAPGGNEPPSYTPDDLSLIHRSGASIRLNDKHPGVTTPAEDEYSGITGAMSTVANRAIHLIGSKFLPYGLMAEHASQSAKIDINDESDGYAYADIFDDAEPSSTYYQPWATDAIGKKFLGPPHADLGGTEVGSDEFYLLHQGGGVMKMYPQPSDTEYTGFKIAVGGWTISVGKEYWDAGIQNVDSSGDAHVDTRSTAPVEGQILLQNSAGASIKIDPSGDIIIDSQGAIKLGGASASNNVLSSADTTDKHIVTNAFGIPTYEAPIGHDHDITAGQSEVKVP